MPKLEAGQEKSDWNEMLIKLKNEQRRPKNKFEERLFKAESCRSANTKVNEMQTENISENHIVARR